MLLPACSSDVPQVPRDGGFGGLQLLPQTSTGQAEGADICVF